MPPHRLALALAVGCLAVVAGLGACALAPEGPASEISELAVASLGLEIFLALAALAGGLLSRRSLAARLGLGPSRVPGACLALLVLGTLGVSHGLDGLLELSGLRERSALAEFDAALAGAGQGAFWLALLGIGLAPGVGEELLCRGLVQKGIEPALGPGRAVVAAALVFGILHGDVIHGASAAILGLYLGTVAVLAGSVRAAILCHTVNNLVAVATAARLPEARIPGLGSALVGLAVAAACLWAVQRRRSSAAWRAGGPGRPAPDGRTAPAGAPPPPTTRPTIGLQPRAGSDDP
jgi:membrane protease YdiL (CAAX protease family)